MAITCTRYREHQSKSLRGVADLAFDLPEGIRLIIKDFTIYEQGGEQYVNPPATRYSGGLAAIVRIPERSHREQFRAAVLAAIVEYRGQQPSL
jgi:hypothetical protein